MRKSTENELRCYCSRRPLLAIYGLTSNLETYIHLKVYKQGKIFGEMIATGGVVRLHCRECFRWYTVKMETKNKAELVEDTESILNIRSSKSIP